MLLILMPELGTEVGQRDVGRTVGVGGQEVGRLPDAATGAGHVHRVARGVRGVDRDRADLAGAPVIAAGPTAVHSWLESAVGLAQREDAEAELASSLPGSPRPEVGNGFWKVSDQLLNVPVLAAARGGIAHNQRPGPGSIQARERGEWHLRIEGGEERRGPVLNRCTRIVIENGVGEIGRMDAGTHSTEEWNRNLARVALVVVERGRQIGVIGIGQVDLNSSAADT